MASNNLTMYIDIERTTTRWRRKTKNLTLEISEDLTREWLRRKTKDLTLEISEDLTREWFRCVGAEIVVHCNDCKWYKTMYCKMDRWTDLVTVYVAKADDYCSYGERRTE